MTPRTATDEPGLSCDPIDTIDADEQQALADLASGARPRIQIDEALNKDWFEIWYQPKIDLKRKCLAGAEALARLRHPEFGVLPPGSFLPDVNEDGIKMLNEHALVSTLRNWNTFNDAGFNLHFAINVPVSVLERLPISELVQENKPSAPNWPGLILEVTEDQIVRNIKLANEIAQQLRVNGITISIDDFGAGFSCLASLRELQFAELKLDHSFVTRCAIDPTNAAICQTAIDLAHRFGSAAVGEGIENGADLQALTLMGCGFGQGALIAPPMPKERFLDVLRQHMNRSHPQPRMRQDASAA